LLTGHINAILGGRGNPTDDIEAGMMVIEYNIEQNSGAIKNLQDLEQKLVAE